ncbi:MAG: 4-alpha-glucanotransferase [Pyrinomonadaceae bacterium]
MKFPRGSGILLHPTSLPGEYGIGDLGPQAFKFVDFLAEAKQMYWQILPLGPTGWGDSPYASFSAFAGNTLLISPERLTEDGLLEVDSQQPGNRSERVDYGAVYESKSLMLRRAFESWRGTDRSGFETFTGENNGWLEDYALYRAIKASQDHKPWFEWDDRLKLRDENALSEARQDLSDELLAEKIYQFLFFKQWSELKEYANGKGVKIVGDVPIFVALDSADVWRHPDQFKLNPDGSPKVVSGVPPDYFSKTGQLWGNPIYDWDAMRTEGFSWWIDRVRCTLKTVDILRVDHFRGFAGAWEVPGGNPTAEHGEWVDAPGRELFTALKNAFGELPFWVEDLGLVTPEVEALRDDFEFPGMRILQFAFGGDALNDALPHNYIRNCIVYTGTHDNDTVVGWWNSLPPYSDARKFCEKYLSTDGHEVNWELIRAAWASVADMAVAPLQDVLGRDNEARMNLPSSTSGNWQWRFGEGDLTDEVVSRLKELTEIYGRGI